MTNYLRKVVTYLNLLTSLNKIKYLLKYQTPLIYLFLVAAFIPYIYISFYTNPIADDFGLAAAGRDAELGQLLVYQYFNWSGRYTSNFFNLINPISHNLFWLYKLIPIVVITFIIASFNFFVRAIVGTPLSFKKSLSYALLLSLLFIYQMPIISEGIYWYTGATTYTFGSSSLLISLGLLSRLYKERFLFNSKYTHLIITVLMLFITIGFIELFMIALLLVAAFIYIIIVKRNLKHKNIALFILISSIAFSLLTYFAPGNAARGSLFPNNHQFIYSVSMSLLQTIRFFFAWISSIPLLLLSILYFPLNKKWSVNNKLFANSFYLTPLTSLGLLFFAIFIGSFPAYWATGILGQHRTMNISYLMFIIMWFVCLTVFYNLKSNWNFVVNEKIKWAIFLLIWGSFVFTKNGYNVLIDLQSNTAHEYNEQMTERYSIIKNHQEGPIYFKPISNPPKTLYVLDITEDPNNWMNISYNQFFKVKNEIILKKHKTTTSSPQE